MNGFVDREHEIFEVLNGFTDADLDFIVVGGYAVSAFQHRFSVDADLVIQDEQLAQFVGVLEDSGFGEVQDVMLDPYGGRYLAFELDRTLPVTIDLLVDALRCRQTEATWEFSYLREHSATRRIEGSERSVEVRIPEKELLVAIKLHAGRLTDARDAVALAEGVDVGLVRAHLDRGDREKLGAVLDAVDRTISSDDFEDAFKGVFQTGTIPENNIRSIRAIIEAF